MQNICLRVRKYQKKNRYLRFIYEITSTIYTFFGRKWEVYNTR